MTAQEYWTAHLYVLCFILYFLLFIFAIESYLFAYTFRLHGFLKEATNEFIQSLREGWDPNQITYYYF